MRYEKKALLSPTNETQPVVKPELIHKVLLARSEELKQVPHTPTQPGSSQPADAASDAD